MKPFVKIILLLLIFSNAKGQWTELIIQPDFNLQQITFNNLNNGFIVGNHKSFEKGIILKTSNHGNSWDTLLYNFPLYTLYFPNEKTGYAGGQSVLSSSDSGQSWTIKESLPYPTESLYFNKDSIGFSGGSDGFSIQKTIDAGDTWTSHNIGPSNSFIQDFSFINDSTGIAVGWYIGKVTKTTDAGNTWKDITNDYQLFAVEFPSANVGYAVGWYGTVIKTVDSGNTWVEQSSGISSPNNINSIFCLNENNCYAVGDNGIIIKTTNGGQGWEREISPTTQRINSIYCTNSACFAVGDSGIILKKDISVGMINPERGQKNNLLIFPNPAKSEIKIQYKIEPKDQNVCIVLSDLQGRIIQKIPVVKSIGTHDVLFDTKNIVNGIYQFTLYSDSTILGVTKISIVN